MRIGEEYVDDQFQIIVQGDLLSDVGVSGAVGNRVDHQHEWLLMQLGHPRAPEVVRGPVVLQDKLGSGVAVAVVLTIGYFGCSRE